MFFVKKKSGKYCSIQQKQKIQTHKAATHKTNPSKWRTPHRTSTCT